MADRMQINIRNADGTSAGRVARAPDGRVVAEVLDEGARWLVELAAERHGAPMHPRPRPSCSPSGDVHSHAAVGKGST